VTDPNAEAFANYMIGAERGRSAQLSQVLRPRLPRARPPPATSSGTGQPCAVALGPVPRRNLLRAGPSCTRNGARAFIGCLTVLRNILSIFGWAVQSMPAARLGPKGVGAGWRTRSRRKKRQSFVRAMASRNAPSAYRDVSGRQVDSLRRRYGRRTPLVEMTGTGVAT
jgi:hypothetical protein